MAYHPRNKRFTIYDAMEERGEFAKNPANREAMNEDGTSAYRRAEFPKMIYHPEGKERIVAPGEPVATVFGPKMVGEQRELINKIVNTQEELDAAIAEGWHLRPGDAIAKRTGEAPPPQSAQERIEQLERDLALEKARGAIAEASKAGATIVPKAEGKAK